jgi:hypothetical protein
MNFIDPQALTYTSDCNVSILPYFRLHLDK